MTILNYMIKKVSILTSAILFSILLVVGIVFCYWFYSIIQPMLGLTLLIGLLGLYLLVMLIPSIIGIRLLIKQYLSKDFFRKKLILPSFMILVSTFSISISLDIMNTFYKYLKVEGELQRCFMEFTISTLSNNTESAREHLYKYEILTNKKTALNSLIKSKEKYCVYRFFTSLLLFLCTGSFTAHSDEERLKKTIKEIPKEKQKGKYYKLIELN